MLRWGSGPLDEDLVGKFDIVLCADWLVFLMVFMKIYDF